ncbi:hypothetical protein AM501_11160 [Aneurinibacillus migulanus]|uniref:serine dehydratase beta chain n=1 Tax=Aneurinibacillus migulanus TaxID=47500 RepID=UPI0005BCC99A|nr:serine dehydratase beta chain [Aneurinibacillus migulanus]KIV53829.1 hypothetical protein TS64_18105 [Aneurinibacillus migulanus]KPD08178.1 hypothetical protein AM501_11160 [Aneurinibacillus migulanus]MCP1357063.1 hypothetical protein [Aneurinibacillus migulanus]CEH30480.1 L-serine dehydratase, iron-sulfur-dependent, beta subunit [Aneurinibacillus migulanus]
MVYNSCFDIIGPIMVGPSSSHTAGVVSIGSFVYNLLDGAPDKVNIIFYDSFAETYKGHGTDKAIVGGLLGMTTDDVRIRDSLTIAKEQGIEVTFKLKGQCPYYDHPNIVFIQAERQGELLAVGGVSLGGGISKVFHINGFSVTILLNAPYDREQVREYRKKRISSVGIG